MANEVQDLREAIASLNKRLDELSSLAKKVEELASGMNITREMWLQLNTSSSKKQRNATKSYIPEADEHYNEGESESHEKVEREVVKYRKLELPVFDREDHLGWFVQVERYFHINGIAERKKLEATVVCLEGRALNWYQWKEMRTSLGSWSEFKIELLKQFHSSQQGGEYWILVATKQERSVLEYVEELERLSSPLRMLPKSV